MGSQGMGEVGIEEMRGIKGKGLDGLDEIMQASQPKAKPIIVFISSSHMKGAWG
jgi:hypothetical protein